MAMTKGRVDEIQDKSRAVYSEFMYQEPPNASVVVVELYISRSAGDYHSQRTTIFRVIYTKRFTKEQLKNGIPS